MQENEYIQTKNQGCTASKSFSYTCLAVKSSTWRTNNKFSSLIICLNIKSKLQFLPHALAQNQFARVI